MSNYYKNIKLWQRSKMLKSYLQVMIFHWIVTLSAARSALGRFRHNMTTSAPRRYRSLAVANPIPLLAPENISEFKVMIKFWHKINFHELFFQNKSWITCKCLTVLKFVVWTFNRNSNLWVTFSLNSIIATENSLFEWLHT